MSTFFQGRRVLVTGGSGFLGSAVLARLAVAGADSVIAPSSAEYDLRDRAATADLFSDAQPELVIHLAARVGGIGANQLHPAELYLDNLLMGTYVIDEALKRDTPKTVVVGTICSYPKFTPVPFSEDSLWNGYPEETNAPYGVAKKAILVGAQAYREQYGTSAVYLLPANLYGPGDNFHETNAHVIPDLIRKMSGQTDQVVLWGDGSPTREFLYVDDCVEGLVLAAERYDGPEPVNLGTGVETSIRETAELVAELVGFHGEIVWDTSMPNGQPRRRLDASRASELFGFRAQVPLREGIARTVAWYRARA